MKPHSSCAPEAQPAHPAKLFCFPNAGGTTARYIAWKKRLPASVQVVPLEYPGRGMKSAVPLCRDLKALLATLVEEIAPQLAAPYYFFGHSMGATVAFELGRQLQARGYPLPKALIISGRRAPHIRVQDLLHRLPDRQLVEALQAFDGIPAPLLERPDVLNHFLPIIRADLEALETWQPGSGEKLRCDLYLFGGTHDPLAPTADLVAWRAHVEGSTRINLFPGGHFYLDDNVSEVTSMIASVLGETA
ncbi:thioesterase II family protein [Pseudomonas japonica]|nr:alpha/beta fold hydrolase [Pseudomonas japonica]